MQLINIYEYIDYINEAKQEDLPYPKFDMIYIYSKFLQLEITVDMVLVDKVFTNLKEESIILSEKGKLTSDMLCTINGRCILFRELKYNIIINDWQINGCRMDIKKLVDSFIEINQDFYNAFCKQVMQEKNN